MMSSMYTLLLLFVTIQLVSGVEQVESRCRHPSRDKCTWDYHSMAIRCDQTNVTSIPDPTGIEAWAPPEESPYLFVNRSCIKSINSGALTKYTNLMFLDLCENYIQKLPGGAFRKSAKLQKLFIAGNKISHVDKNAFTGLIALMYLHLGNNKLKKISGRSLQEVGKTLIVLKLNNNQLEAIRKTTFTRLKRLETLDLGGNNLHKFEPHHLKGLVMLRVIHLQENNLTSFHKHIFLAAYNIEEVDLSNNSISCLDDDVFDSEKLSVVKLSGNPLETPKLKWIPSGEKGHLEIASKGKWVCNCQVYSYNNHLKTLPEEERELYDIVCNAPAPVSGRMLSSLSWEHLSKHSNCSIPDESLKCKPIIQFPAAPSFQLRTTSRMAHRTTTSPSLVTRAVPDNSVIIATVKPNTTDSVQTAKVSPSSNGQVAGFVWKNEYAIYIVVGVSVLVITCLLLLLFCKIQNRNEKETCSVDELEPSHTSILTHPSIDVENPPVPPQHHTRRVLQTHSHNPCPPPAPSAHATSTRPTQRMSRDSCDDAETFPKAVNAQPHSQASVIPNYFNEVGSSPQSSHDYASIASGNHPNNVSFCQERLEPQGGPQQPLPTTQRQPPIGSPQDQNPSSTSRSSFVYNVTHSGNHQEPCSYLNSET